MLGIFTVANFSENNHRNYLEEKIMQPFTHNLTTKALNRESLKFILMRLRVLDHIEFFISAEIYKEHNKVQSYIVGYVIGSYCMQCKAVMDQVLIIKLKLSDIQLFEHLVQC